MIFDFERNRIMIKVNDKVQILFEGMIDSPDGKELVEVSAGDNGIVTKIDTFPNKQTGKPCTFYNVKLSSGKTILIEDKDMKPSLADITDSALDRRWNRLNDKITDLEDKQGEVQENIEECEAAGKNIDGLNTRFEAISNQITAMEDEKTDIEDECDRRAKAKNLDHIC